MTENIPNLMKEIRPQVWEAVAIKQYIKHKEFCAKTYQNKTEKKKRNKKTINKEKILKVARWKRYITFIKGGEKD